MSTPQRPVVVSGMRPTGRLHIGHLHGALANWVRLQEESDCYFFSAEDCKRKLLERLLPEQERIRERREALLARPGDIDEIVRLGTGKARAVAQRTMGQVREAMKLVLR